MAQSEVAAALRRAQDVMQRRPEVGVHEDSSATARWQGDTRFVTHHPNGTQVASDMPREFGGTGDQITPGWLFRAGLAACAGTTIAMLAATRGIELESLEVVAGSVSDSRGFLGMREADGRPVPARPMSLRLQVRARARSPEVSPQTLEALIREVLDQSPIPDMARHAMPLVIEVEAR